MSNIKLKDHNWATKGIYDTELQMTQEEINNNNTFQITDTQAMLATVETTNIASKYYAVGDMLVYNGKLYRVKVPTISGDTITPGTNVVATTVEETYQKQLEVRQVYFTFSASIAPGQGPGAGLKVNQNGLTALGIVGTHADPAGDLIVYNCYIDSNEVLHFNVYNCSQTATTKAIEISVFVLYQKN